MARVTKQSISVNLYAIVSERVEAGVAAGIRHAYKHAERQLTAVEIERLENHVANDVMSSLSEVIAWGRIVDD
jgi:hypothetical protein